MAAPPGKFVLGALFFGILALQAFGLNTVSTTTGAFLSSTTVAFVSILQMLLYRTLPNPTVVIGAALVILGVLVVELGESLPGRRVFAAFEPRGSLAKQAGPKAEGAHCTCANEG